MKRISQVHVDSVIRKTHFQDLCNMVERHEPHVLAHTNLIHYEC
jgi:hypothetical protein